MMSLEEVRKCDLQDPYWPQTITPHRVKKAWQEPGQAMHFPFAEHQAALRRSVVPRPLMGTGPEEQFQMVWIGREPEEAIVPEVQESGEDIDLEPPSQVRPSSKVFRPPAPRNESIVDQLEDFPLAILNNPPLDPPTRVKQIPPTRGAHSMPWPLVSGKGPSARGWWPITKKSRRPAYIHPDSWPYVQAKERVQMTAD